jgi:DUF1009 family protein
MEKLGLIAGNRKFPLLVAQGAKKKNYYVVAVAIKGDTLPGLKNLVDKIYWIGLAEFASLFEIFKKESIKDIIMAGQISPHRLFSREMERAKDLKELLASIKDKKADTIFGAIAEKLKGEGMQLLDSTTFIEEYMPKKGTLTRKSPDFSTWEDIYFGLEQAKAIAYLDIGQTVAVKSKAVVAVEALEGTDNLIRRSGRLSRGGFSVIKVSKPNQDMRFDVPVVGLNTIKGLVSAGARALAIEAGKTLFIDKEKSVELADAKGISIVSV